jgi:biopolymer transport protein ExbB/TolQ
LVVNLALQQVINSAVPAGSYIHRIFRPQGGWIMGVVPALIFFIFIWTLTDLFFKLRVARANEADLIRSDVNQVPNLVRQEPTSVMLQRLRTWDLGVLARPVGRRVLWLLQHLDTVDAQRAHELTRHQSDLETDTVASGYRTVRLFIWAMPILGFIGTVLGISIAVGGFSDFLTTNVSIDEIDRVTAELGNVAGGLSFAFDTTLLGLLAGLVSSVASTAVQGKEERFLTGLEELGLRIMENAQPAGGAPAIGGPAGTPVGEEFDAMMRTRLQELSTQMQQFTRAVQSGLDGFLAEWGKLPPEVERVAGDLAGLREQLTSAAKSTDKMILETRLMLEGLNEASTHLGNRLTSSIGSISQTVDGLGNSLGGVSQMLESSLAGLGERVQSSERYLESGMTRLRDAIEASKRDDGAIQAALEQLTSTMSELGGTLEGMRPLMTQLSGPLELRLMPTPVASPLQR